MYSAQKSKKSPERAGQLLYQGQRTAHKSFQPLSHITLSKKKKKKSPSSPKIPCSSALRPMIAPENSRNPDYPGTQRQIRAYYRWKKKGGEGGKGEEEFNGRVYARS